MDGKSEISIFLPPTGRFRPPPSLENFVATPLLPRHHAVSYSCFYFRVKDKFIKDCFVDLLVFKLIHLVAWCTFSYEIALDNLVKEYDLQKKLKKFCNWLCTFACDCGFINRLIHIPLTTESGLPDWIKCVSQFIHAFSTNPVVYSLRGGHSLLDSILEPKFPSCC